MESLKTEYGKDKMFYRILGIAIAVNIVFAAAFVYASVSVKDVTVTVNGRSAQYKTRAVTVSDMLEEWDVKLDKNDVIEPSLATRLTDNMEISIDLYEVTTETITEETDYKTKKKYSSDLLEGEKKVTREGVKGKDEVTYEVTYLGGKEQSRKEIDRKTVEKPVAEIITKGTAVAIDGERYSRKLTVQSTAYTGGGRTATGTRARVGEIAVDPSVIPLGSECYIEGFGKVTAEDTGGAVKGNIINIYMSSQSAAIKWGRRTVTIYIK